MPTTTSRWLRRIAALVLLAVAGTACGDVAIPEVVAPATPTPTPAPTSTPAPTVVNQPTPTPRPFEGEPGVTEDTIRIGVIYDTGVSPVGDAMSASAAEAVEAWATSVNTEGGIAGGRAVEVIRIETQPLLGDHAEAIDRACNSDIFALVGSSSIFDSVGLDQLTSPACGLPDFPAVVYSPERLKSPVTTVSNPIMGDVWQAGWARYLADRRPRAASAAAAMYLEFPVSVINGERLIEAASTQGYEFVYQAPVAFDPAYGAMADDLERSEAELLTWAADGGRLIGFLEELDRRDARPNVVDCGMWCYSAAWAEAAGDTGEGVLTWLPTMPLEESEAVPELTRYLFWRGTTSSGELAATSVGVLAWASALLFEEAVDRAIGQSTSEYDPNKLTRLGVVEAASTITDWDARGLHGPSNPAEGLPSSCFVLLTRVEGVWERTFPTRRGVLNCADRNLVELTITIGISEEGDDTITGGDDVEEPSSDEG